MISEDISSKAYVKSSPVDIIWVCTKQSPLSTLQETKVALGQNHSIWVEKSKGNKKERVMGHPGHDLLFFPNVDAGYLMCLHTTQEMTVVVKYTNRRSKHKSSQTDNM